jgi:hypothetical protein
VDGMLNHIMYKDHDDDDSLSWHRERPSRRWWP